MRPSFLVVCLAVSLLLSGCTWGPDSRTDSSGPETGSVEAGPQGADPSAAVAEVLLEVGSLTQAVAVPGSDGDLLVLERRGRVLFFDAQSGDHSEVLDIGDRVDPSANAERGLKGIALHPDFRENGMVFLVYDDTFDPDEDRAGYGHVTRFFADPADLSAGLQEGDVVLEVDFPGNWFHNMGGVAFGPDGMLWLGIGDGSKDRMSAQDLGVLHGSVLRLDVDAQTGYKVPGDNPFVDDPDARGEVVLYGFRNPWRIAFHPDSGDLFVANAGESDVESVYLFPADGDTPRNHGWPHMEGSEPFRDYEYGEPEGDVNLPIVEYATHEDGGCALVGGAVYQGAVFPSLEGAYVFADHCSGRLMTAREEQGDWVLSQWFEIDGEMINSVDLDGNGEVLVSAKRGKLYQVFADEEPEA